VRSTLRRSTHPGSVIGSPSSQTSVIDGDLSDGTVLSGRAQGRAPVSGNSIRNFFGAKMSGARGPHIRALAAIETSIAATALRSHQQDGTQQQGEHPPPCRAAVNGCDTAAHWVIASHDILVQGVGQTMKGPIRSFQADVRELFGPVSPAHTGKGPALERTPLARSDLRR
jgi:hypothetical protein